MCVALPQRDLVFHRGVTAASRACATVTLSLERERERLLHRPSSSASEEADGMVWVVGIDRSGGRIDTALFRRWRLDVKMQGPYIATVIYHRRWTIVSADLQAYVHSRYPRQSATTRRDVQNGALKRKQVRGVEG